MTLAAPRAGAGHGIARWPLAITLRRLVLLACISGAFAGTCAAQSLDEARALADQGRDQEALDAVDAVLALTPADISARLLRNVLLSRTGNSDAAIDGFKAIARDRPDLPEAYNNLAVLYAARGRYEEARESLLAAIRLQPDYDLAQENLGDVYAKLASLAYARARQINGANTRAAAKRAAAEQVLAVPRPDGAPPAPARVAPVRTSTPAAPAPPAPTPMPAPALSAPPASALAATPATACVRVPELGPPQRAQQVAAWFGRHGLEARVVPGAAPAAPAGATSYRVYVPPLADVAAARARVAELRSAGVEDLILITDGELANGISLGVFAQRAGAARRIRELAARGLFARLAPRGAGAAAPSAAVEARGAFDPDAFARAFADLRFSIEDCP